VGALIMLGTLLGLIVLIFALVLRFDPEARSPGPDRE
jgi:H+/Cl- antiporter ClcA